MVSTALAGYCESKQRIDKLNFNGPNKNYPSTFQIKYVTH